MHVAHNTIGACHNESYKLLLLKWRHTYSVDCCVIKHMGQNHPISLGMKSRVSVLRHNQWAQPPEKPLGLKVLYKHKWCWIVSCTSGRTCGSMTVWSLYPIVYYFSETNSTDTRCVLICMANKTWAAWHYCFTEKSYDEGTYCLLSIQHFAPFHPVWEMDRLIWFTTLDNAWQPCHLNTSQSAC